MHFQALLFSTFLFTFTMGCGSNPTVTGDVLCLGDPPLPSFRNFNAAGGGLADNAKHSTDASPHECKFPELSPVSW